MVRQPLNLDRRRVRQLLRAASPETSLAERMNQISARLAGAPYRGQLLIGSANAPEVFVASTKEFDCVTYIETVLALGLSASETDFVDTLRRIRYEGGRIGWRRRNHYMTQWIRNNSRMRFVRPAPGLRPDVGRKRLLDVLTGLPPRQITMKCLPKTELIRNATKLQTGDLIFFASTRRHMDIFHCGMIVRDGDRIAMRHASRSKGGVVEQDLDDFLAANRMAGVIVVRPVSPGRAA